MPLCVSTSGFMLVQHQVRQHALPITDALSCDGSYCKKHAIAPTWTFKYVSYERQFKSALSERHTRTCADISKSQPFTWCHTILVVYIDVWQIVRRGTSSTARVAYEYLSLSSRDGTMTSMTLTISRHVETHTPSQFTHHLWPLKQCYWRYPGKIS